jgi:DNA-binding CsgD family transcriptional regulator
MDFSKWQPAWCSGAGDLSDRNPLLEQVIATETLREILAEMTPEERRIARLRVMGDSDARIAERLKISRSAVSARMRRCQRRIERKRPDLAPFLKDRLPPSPR